MSSPVAHRFRPLRRFPLFTDTQRGVLRERVLQGQGLSLVGDVARLGLRSTSSGMLDHGFTYDAGYVRAGELLEGLERPQFLFVKSHSYRSSSHKQDATSSYSQFGGLRFSGNSEPFPTSQIAFQSDWLEIGGYHAEGTLPSAFAPTYACKITHRRSDEPAAQKFTEPQ